MDTETRAFLEAMEKRISEEIGTVRAEMREGVDSMDRRLGAVDKGIGGLGGAVKTVSQQVESLAQSTASEFGRVHERLDEITANTARSFAGVESRMQQFEA
ncbi:MAG: hypothetical protein AAF194_03570 [Pseudomonadota bacterium]